MSYQVETIDDRKSPPTIKITHYEYQGDPENHGRDDSAWEVIASFDLVFTNEYAFKNIIYTENPSYTVDELVLREKEARDVWGLTEYIYDSQDMAYTTFKIKSLMLRNQLRFGALCRYFKFLISSKDAFDLLIPLALNAILFILWTLNFFFTK